MAASYGQHLDILRLPLHKLLSLYSKAILKVKMIEKSSNRLRKLFLFGIFFKYFY